MIFNRVSYRDAPIPWKIELTTQQARQVEIVAQKRMEKKKNYYSSTNSDIDAFSNHYVGAFGEVSCRIFLDAQMDYRSLGYKGDGGMPDIVLPNSVKAQVKTRRGGYKDCYVEESCMDKLQDKDLIILIWFLSSREGYFAGFLEKEEFLTQAKKTKKYTSHKWENRTQKDIWSYEVFYQKFKDIRQLLKV